MKNKTELLERVDRVTAERDAAQADAELWRSRCGAKCYSVTVLRGLLDRVVTEVGRTITSELRADIDVEMSSTRSPEIDALQQRLTAADEREDQRAALTNDDLIAIARTAALNSVHRYNYMPCLPEEAYKWEPHYWVIEAMRAALNPSEGGGDE